MMSPPSKPYGAYVASGDVWIGKIPAEWKLLPAFSVFKPKLDKNIGLTNKNVLSLSYGRIVKKPMEKLHGLVPESFETYQIVLPGDIIIRSTDMQNDRNSLRVGIVRETGIITSAYICLSTLGGMTPEYGYHLLNAYDVQKFLYAYGSGMRQNLDFVHLRRVLLPVPSIREQHSIVQYIDDLDVQVSALILHKKASIRLLEEQRRTITHELVTKGLVPDVRKRDSGIDWLGHVPEHWAVKRLRYVAAVKTGERNTEDAREDGQYLFFVRSQTVERIGSYSFDGEAVLTAGDGAGVAKVFHYINGKFDYHQRTYKFSHFRGITGRFFFHYLRAHLEYEALKFSAKSTVDSLRLPMLKNFPVVLPPIEEQDQIVREVDRRTGAIDAAIQRAKKEIDLIIELKRRMSVDAVMGRIDLRDYASLLPTQRPKLDENEETEYDDTADEPVQEAEEARV